MISSKNQAIQTALQGNWKNATSLNKSLLSANPNDIGALNRLAFAFTLLDKIKEAKATYRKVLKIDSVNPIALRNLKRLKEEPYRKKTNGFSGVYAKSFIETPGKTKIIELVNVAQPKIVSGLITGQVLNLIVKRLKVFIEDQKQYIGVLPDDVGKRLIKFIKGGSIYEAYVKSANSNRVVVFLREVKMAPRFKNQPSFLEESIKNLSLDKNNTDKKNKDRRIKIQSVDEDIMDEAEKIIEDQE